MNKLDQLAAKDYIIRLDTAEKQLQPQSDHPKEVKVKRSGMVELLGLIGLLVLLLMNLLYHVPTAAAREPHSSTNPTMHRYYRDQGKQLTISAY